MTKALWILIPLMALALSCPEPPNLGGFIGPGELSNRLRGDSVDYFCHGRTGDVITIALKGLSPGLDPRVWLVDPDGVEEAFDDDGGGDGNSLIRQHTLRRTGVYTIRVGSYEDRPGGFTLTVDGSCREN